MFDGKIGDHHRTSLDVLIVGAGISGIATAAALKHRLPDKRFAILEGRKRVGGTWDLFRYPGVRSDSDMFTLGFGFKPWTEARGIADGAAIRHYVEEAANELELDRRILFETRVTAADWDPNARRWRVEAVDREGISRFFSARFLAVCAGYYDYAQGHRPTWPGEALFEGQIVHPQHWPDALDVEGRDVVVIGSGATAVTLAPALAAAGARVTLLQRSPTYIVARPAKDRLAGALMPLLPARARAALVRGKNILLGEWFFAWCRRQPERARDAFLKPLRERFGDETVERHFTPRYKPWDQRLCLVPDGDLFDAIAAGKVRLVTDGIEGFEAKGVKLASGDLIPADLVATATGLKLNLLGDIKVSIDGDAVNLAETVSYKGCMFSGVPNLFHQFGYTNASWTLKVELAARYICRLIGWLDRRGYVAATPVRDPDAGEQPLLELASGYVERALAMLPKQGLRHPWKVHQRYSRDWWLYRRAPIDDGALRFERPLARDLAL